MGTTMKVYDLKDEDGGVFAFEVDNIALGRRGLCRVVSKIPGAALLRRPVRFLSWFRESTFCEFELDGVRFSADEGPWGDSSRYGVGPEPPRWVPQLEVVRQAFLNHNPLMDASSLVRIVIGGVLVALVVWALWTRAVTPTFRRSPYRYHLSIPQAVSELSHQTVGGEVHVER
jgi:hypothetical protein